MSLHCPIRNDYSCSADSDPEGVADTMITPPIGARIRALREQHHLTQEDLARVFGFKDRQTVSAIENGTRRVTADELLLAVEKFHVSLNYFTDPFLLVGEGRFSWRHSGLTDEELSQYERRAGSWIAAYRHLAPQVGVAAPFLRRSLPLKKNSSYEAAMAAGERFADEFEVGPTPAESLVRVMEQDFGILVLMVDAEPGISGAACRLPELDVALIARGEIAGRRHFDLAHELFHLLTWQAMPPEHSEQASTTSRSRVEQLANNFAGALLMPAAVIKRYGPWSDLDEEALVVRLNNVADGLQVTSSALRWRLVALGEISKSAGTSLPETALRNNGRPSVEIKDGAIKIDRPPARFSRRFTEVISRAVEQGLISLRRTASLLESPVEGVGDLFAEHGLKRPVEL